MKKITILIALMITSLGFAQQVLIEDFETAPPTNFTIRGFEGLGSATIAADPAAGGTRLNGLKLESVTTGNPWQGAEVIIKGKKIKLRTDKTIKVDVYSTKAFTMLCKVELGDAAENSAAAQAYTTPNEWQTLTFTMNQSLDNTKVANGDYGAIVFFPNWNGTGFTKPSSDFFVQVDNIVAEKAEIVVIVDPAPTTAAPTPQLQNASGVASIFSNLYTNIAIDEWPTEWSRGSSSDVQIAGNDTKKLKLTDFIGIDFQNSPINATEMDRWHMDFWVTEANLDGKVFNVKLIDFAGTAAEVTPTVVYNFKNVGTNPVIESGRWVTIDVPLQGTNKSDIKQAVIISNMLGAIYIDNFYLYNSKLGTKSFADLGAKMHPNPTTGRVTIEAKNIIERISLHNVLGQEILVRNPKSQTTTLDISNLQAGVYVVKTTVNGKVASSRVVKK